MKSGRGKPFLSLISKYYLKRCHMIWTVHSFFKVFKISAGFV